MPIKTGWWKPDPIGDWGFGKFTPPPQTNLGAQTSFVPQGQRQAYSGSVPGAQATFKPYAPAGFQYPAPQQDPIDFSTVFSRPEQPVAQGPSVFEKPTSFQQMGQQAQPISPAQAWWNANGSNVKPLLPSQQTNMSGTVQDAIQSIRRRYAMAGLTGTREEMEELDSVSKRFGQMSETPSQQGGVNPYKIFY